jgi:hypothetical protein
VSGEDSPEGWTLDTLRVHLQSRVDALDRLTESRSRAQDEKVALAMAAADKATAKQEVDTNHRLALLNELRTDVATKQALDALAERVGDMKERLDKLEGRSGGLNTVLGYAVALSAVVVAVIAMVTR